MEQIKTCLICEHPLNVASSICLLCKWDSKVWLSFDFMSVHERIAYLTRISEAKERWLKLGRYDQSPKVGKDYPKAPSSSNSIAIEGGLL